MSKERRNWDFLMVTVKGPGDMINAFNVVGGVSGPRPFSTKVRTQDPGKMESNGKGIAPGRWLERTYSVTEW